MRPLRIEGATRRLAEEQDEYMALSIRDEVIQGIRVMSSAWELNPKELMYLKAGGSIYVGFSSSNGYIPALLRKPTEAEMEFLLAGGTFVVSVPGNIHPPVCPLITTPEEADTCTKPEKDMVMCRVRKAPELME